MIGYRIFQGLVFALGLLSLWMIVDGVIHNEWWAGLGLILGMSSILSWFSIFPSTSTHPQS